MKGHVQRLQAHRRRWPCRCFVAVTALLPNLPLLWGRVEALAAGQGVLLAGTVVLTEAVMLMSWVALPLALAGLIGQNVMRLLGLLLMPVSAVLACFMWQHQVVMDPRDALTILATDHGLGRQVLVDPLLGWALGGALLALLIWWQVAPPSWWRGPNGLVLGLRWLVGLAVSTALLAGSTALLGRLSASPVPAATTVVDAPPWLDQASRPARKSSTA